MIWPPLIKSVSQFVCNLTLGPISGASYSRRLVITFATFFLWCANFISSSKPLIINLTMHIESTQLDGTAKVYKQRCCQSTFHKLKSNWELLKFLQVATAANKIKTPARASMLNETKECNSSFKRCNFQITPL